MEIEKPTVEKVRKEILERMTDEDRRTKAFYIDEKILKKDKELIVYKNKYKVDTDSIVVFVDEEPGANWAHKCRYLLFDVNTGKVREIPEKFPPSLEKWPETLKPISEPPPKTTAEILREKRKGQKKEGGSPFRVEKTRRFFNTKSNAGECDKRWAILFSGSTNRRHINDLEFMYRTLIDKYGYDPYHIVVLNYDGINAASGWSWSSGYADSSAYTIQINGPGNRDDLIDALDTIGQQLDAESTLFIMTNNHGYESGGEYYICTHSGPSFSGTDMADRLSAMPVFKELLVAMEQCHSGGFIDPVINYSHATRTSIATACRADKSSWGTSVFDFWALDWITAVNEEGPTATYPLEQDPDYNSDGGISGYSAFAYSLTWQYPYDTPQYKDSPLDCGQTMFLGKPDIFVRDALDDDGSEPYTGIPWWNSPDIWLEDENGNPLGTTPIGGTWVQVWTKVANIGCAPAKNVHIRFEAFPFGIGVTEPVQIGHEVVPLLDNGNVVEEMTWWLVPPYYSHACIRVKAECCLDQAMSTGDMWQDIPEDNNQAQKNLAVQSIDPGGWSGIWVDVENPFNKNAKFIIDLQEIVLGKAEPGKIKASLESVGQRQFQMKGLEWKPKERKKMNAKFKVPEDIEIGHTSDFIITAKTEEGVVIGGVTIRVIVSTASLLIALKDETQKEVAGAEVTLKPYLQGKEHSKHTGDDGICIFRKVAPGTYELTITKKGFTTIMKDVTLKPLETVELELIMTREKTIDW